MGAGRAFDAAMARFRAARATEKKVSPRRLLQQRKAVQVDAQSPASLVFHCSGVTCRQWRELRNSLAGVEGKVLFQPSFKKGTPDDPHQTPFASRMASASGPLCMIYLTGGTPDGKWSKLALPIDSVKQSLLLLYGKDRGTLLNHMDIKKVSSLDLTSVYQRGIFGPLFQQMGFLSGLDKMKEGLANESAGGAEATSEKA